MSREFADKHTSVFIRKLSAGHAKKLPSYPNPHRLATCDVVSNLRCYKGVRPVFRGSDSPEFEGPIFRARHTGLHITVKLWPHLGFGEGIIWSTQSVHRCLCINLK